MNLKMLLLPLCSFIPLVPAMAAIKIATYTGTVASGFDRAGIFGVDGEELSGLQFTARYVYDTSLGDSADPAANSNNVFNIAPGQKSPVLRSELTINGYTRIMGGRDYSSINLNAEGIFSINTVDVDFDYDWRRTQLSTGAVLLGDISAINSNLSPTFTSGLGSFSRWVADENGRAIYDLNGTLNIDRVSIKSAATIRTATYLGTLGTGFDKAGLFGMENNDLTGLNFAARYIYDTNLGDRTTVSNNPNNISNSAPMVSSPVFRTELTINGVTRIMANHDYSAINLDDSNNMSLSASDIEFDYDWRRLQISNSAVLPENFNAVSSVTPSVSASGTGYFSRWTSDEITGRQVYDLYGTMHTSSVSVTGSVPEPASWSMMIFGIACLGMKMRTRPSMNTRCYSPE